MILGIIALVNILSDRFFLRLDFTADKRYTLNQATKDILQNLEDPVTVSAYFTQNLPTDYAKIQRDFEELLIEYGTYSRGNVVFEFIDPNETEENEQLAQQSGIAPLLVNVREKDEVKQIKAYMGAIIQMGENKDVIPFLPPDAAMEYALSSSIKKISVLEKPKIAVLQGHGEPGLDEMQQVLAALSVLYDIVPFHLEDTLDMIPMEFKTVAIVAPKDTISPIQFSLLDNFLATGKNIFVACNRVDGDFQTSQGSIVHTGIKDWLMQKQITIDDNFLVDANCGNVSVRQQQGFFTFNQNVKFPYLPVIKNFDDHPITKGLEGVVMKFASTIGYTGTDSLATFTPIAKSSKKSGTQTAPVSFNVQKKWSAKDYPSSNLIVGGIYEKKYSETATGKMVVIGDGDFPVNEKGQQAHSPDNISLMVNAVDWLSDETGLIDLRTKGVTSRPLDEIEDSKKAMLKWTNFLLPIILIIIYGIIRSQMKRRLRNKRRETSYV